jgi:uncharacterized protein YndB with AHSA1/START domain
MGEVDSEAASVDVEVQRVIAAPPDEVAAYAGDPGNAPEWYVNIVAARWRTSPPVAVGSLVDFEARFLGKRLVYTYEVVELDPGRRLVMRTAEGPFPMETTYTWEAAPGGTGTLMRLRNRGRPRGLAAVAAPVMAGAMRRATAKDLERLAGLLER